ncbi:MAG TPA: class I SAM-dependent methyltransferase [Acidimicrobiales bacterium]|nr:class I SAM-dependent methyltransferase [Acidimicrobiales bacterium]
MTASMDPHLLEVALGAKGFMPPDEGLALHRAARAAAAANPALPLVEIGSYCGKSAVYLGAAARAAGTVLFTIDHHRGAEENQVGWEHHDPALVDLRTGRMDSLPTFRQVIEGAGLEDVVIAVVGTSATVARWWSTPLAFVFVDGGHGEVPAHEDYRSWSPKVARGGYLAIHDVFPDPADGGRPPYEIFSAALSSGAFEEVVDASCGSLRILKRVSPSQD